MSKIIKDALETRAFSMARYMFYRVFRGNLPIKALTDEIVTAEKVCAERLHAINRLDGLCKERLQTISGLQQEAKRLREAIGALEAARGFRKEISQ